MATGRQVGKTTLAYEIGVDGCLFDGEADEVAYYVSPTYKLGRKPWRLASRFVRGYKLGDINQSEKIIRWGNQFEYHFRSADDPGDIVGESPMFVICDEAGRLSDDAFDFIEPSTRVHDAVQWRFGTPRGKNRFYRDFLRGLDANGESPLISLRPPVDEHYLSFRAPCDPDIAHWWTKDSVDAIRERMSTAMFRQEIMGEFLEGAASLFGDFDGICISDFEGPEPGGVYVMGVDLAKHEDFTSIRVIRADTTPPREVSYERFQEVNWRLQIAQIVGVATRYNDAMVVLDSTGIGDVVFDDLLAEGLHVTPYKFSTSTKAKLIENFVGKVATQSVLLLKRELDPVAYQEMSDFEFEIISPRGRALGGDVSIRYGTQKGAHDDTVIARALALHGIWQASTLFVL